MREEEIDGISRYSSSYLTEQARTTQCPAHGNGMTEIHDDEIERRVGHGDEESCNQGGKVIEPFPVEIGSDLRKNGTKERAGGVYTHDEGEIGGGEGVGDNAYE